MTAQRAISPWAIIRHILSVVVRLTIPVNLAESRQQLMELVVYAGSALMLVAALVRWSQRRPLSASGRGDSSEQTESALRHLAGVLLHTPSVRARELARDGGAQSVVDAANILFGLDVPDPQAPAARLRAVGDASAETAAS